MKQEICIGISAINDLLCILKKLSPQKIFLVRGKNSFELCGAQLILIPFLKQINCSIIDFFDFEKNPKTEDLEKGLTLLKKHPVDLILSVGGGSTLDMGKLIRFFYSYSGNIDNNIFQKEKELIPLIALPTTAGTGSEATHFAVIYKNKIKYSVAHKDILPNIAVVAAEFTYNNTKYLTACTGFDALSQAIEAYWNVNATKESDEYAIKAIKLLWQNLPLVVNTPNKHIRDQVSIGAYWAGRAINITMTTAPHAFSYPFTTYYHYPHGHAVALTFPFWCKYNFENSSIATNTDWQLKKEILKKLFDIKEDSAALEFFYSYINSIGLFYNLPIDFDYNTIIENINFPRLKNNPIPISHITSITIMKSFVAYSKN